MEEDDAYEMLEMHGKIEMIDEERLDKMLFMKVPNHETLIAVGDQYTACENCPMLQFPRKFRGNGKMMLKLLSILQSSDVTSARCAQSVEEENAQDVCQRTR